MLEIDNTPFPARRMMASKYDEVFAKMHPGQCVKVSTDSVDRVAHSMRKWLQKNNKANDLRVRTISKMPDGYGRVWMMAVKPIKMADVPGRKITKLDIARSL